jgi:hypothetical protein
MAEPPLIPPPRRRLAGSAERCLSYSHRSAFVAGARGNIEAILALESYVDTLRRQHRLWHLRNRAPRDALVGRPLLFVSGVEIAVLVRRLPIGVTLGTAGVTCPSLTL